MEANETLQRHPSAGDELLTSYTARDLHEKGRQKRVQKLDAQESSEHKLLSR